MAKMHGALRRRSAAREDQVQCCGGIAAVVIDAYDGTLIGEHGIEGREDFVGTGIAAGKKIRFARLAHAQYLRQRLCADACWQRFDVAVRRVKATVDEDHARRWNRGQSLDQCCGIDSGRCRSRHECAPLQRTQRSVFPSLAAGTGQAVAQSISQRRASALAEAGGCMGAGRVERGRERIKHSAHRAVVSGATRSLIQAYPCASSSSASSGPPLSTMRPSASTCTTSGLM